MDSLSSHTLDRVFRQGLFRRWTKNSTSVREGAPEDGDRELTASCFWESHDNTLECMVVKSEAPLDNGVERVVPVGPGLTSKYRGELSKESCVARVLCLDRLKKWRKPTYKVLQALRSMSY
ncbi:hypothetical protein CCP4SC76_2970005 [Gammaproteobacteria bacterium]